VVLRNIKYHSKDLLEGVNGPFDGAVCCAVANICHATAQAKPQAHTIKEG